MTDDPVPRMDLRELAFFHVDELAAEDAVDRFVCECLFIHGVWRSERDSDGLSALRVIQREPRSGSLLGQIYLVQTQEEKHFAIELSSEGRDAMVAWKLYYDLTAYGRGRERDTRYAFNLMKNPSEGTWVTTLTGVARKEGPRLVL